MELAAYFDRIHYTGAREPSLATLAALMEAHLAAVPFENLDVQLGRRVGIEIDTAFAKLVDKRRGGWCYEQNGLFGWALAALGFEVRRLCCGVMRAANGDAALGNHLALAVTVDRADWLVDVGFGGSMAAPMPLNEGTHAQPPYELALSREEGGYWRFGEWIDPARPFSFDIAPGQADEALFAARCAELQERADSPFVQNLVVQQRQGARHVSLRGRVLSVHGADGETRERIESADSLVETLHRRFALDVPEAATLWDAICARHDTLFAGTEAE